MTAAKSENRPKYATGQHIFCLKLLYLKNWIAMKKNLLTSAQKKWLKKYFKNNNVHLIISNLEGLAYLLKTGCQWRLLPEYYGAWQTIYYHFRTLGDKEIFCKIKRKLLENKRIKSGKRKYPSVAVIDSQSVRSGLSKSEKGIDGNKKIKGIKRHVCVDSAGLARNYEQFLQTAQIMAEFACMMLLLKYI